jgi:hypothetical protein
VRYRNRAPRYRELGGAPFSRAAALAAKEGAHAEAGEPPHVCNTTKAVWAANSLSRRDFKVSTPRMAAE